MDFAHVVATQLVEKLQSGTHQASTSLPGDKLEATSAYRSGFVTAVRHEVDKQLNGFEVDSLSLSGPDSVELVISCAIRPVKS